MSFDVQIFSRAPRIRAALTTLSLSSKEGEIRKHMDSPSSPRQIPGSSPMPDNFTEGAFFSALFILHLSQTCLARSNVKFNKNDDSENSDHHQFFDILNEQSALFAFTKKIARLKIFQHDL